MAKEQKEKLITAVVTFITTVLSILFLQACTMSMSIAKSTVIVLNRDKKTIIVTGKQIGRAHV